MKFYLTTTLPYVNAKPHIGFALEIVQADIICRYHTLLGHDVIFNTGTDEHGVKIYRKALEEGKEPQDYVDEYAAKFDALKSGLNLTYTNFIRTTNPEHKAAAEEFWKRCLANDDIYKKAYKVKYCVGCELEKTDSDLVDGRCPIHPHKELELIEEENYFFRFSKYGPLLTEFYNKNPDFVIPDFRYNEIKKFVSDGLNDFSISRLKEKMPWGVPVPGDDTQVMYVWFDALVNYISTLGWPENEGKFKEFWPGIQMAGKDNLRQQSAMWQAMLMSAGLPNSKQIVIHGFINTNGQKMSKSLGNVIDPFDIIEKYGTDALRYWLGREMNTFEDGDFTYERFEESYNANLANNLGNLLSRVVKMAESYAVNIEPENAEYKLRPNDHLDKYEIKLAMDEIWGRIDELNAYIQKTEPFKTIKTDPTKAKTDVKYVLEQLYRVGVDLEPYMPETSKRIRTAVLEGSGSNALPLFPRLEENK
jgi:methionyl-tRNA synthetase